VIKRRACANTVRVRLAVAYVVFAALAACSKGEQETQPPPAATKPPAVPVAATGTGEVTGRIIFEGAVPEARIVPMSADPYCAKANPDGARQETVRVAADRGLAGVFVYVSKGLESVRYTPPTEPMVLDQRACWYTPTVMGVQVGQPLEVRNSDETLHNVHALAEITEGFNIGMPHKGMSAVRKFSEPEVLVRIKCDVHPWMAAFAGVVAHPFYAVTGEDGSYRLSGMPAGDFTIAAVHPELGVSEQQIQLADGAHVNADFKFTQ
jgi:hypothetical protein